MSESKRLLIEGLSDAVGFVGGALLGYRFMTSPKREGPGWEPYQWDAAGRPKRWRYDCSTPGNKVCRGVWTRQQARHAACMEAQ